MQESSSEGPFPLHPECRASLLSGCQLAVPSCWRGLVPYFRRTTVRPLPCLLQYVTTTSIRLCSLLLDWEGWSWAVGVLQVKSSFQQYLSLHLYLSVFQDHILLQVTELAPGYCASLFAYCGLLLPKLSALGYADGQSYLAYNPALFCCITFSCRNCWCKQFQSGTLYKKKSCT